VSTQQNRKSKSEVCSAVALVYIASFCLKTSIACKLSSHKNFYRTKTFIVRK